MNASPLPDDARRLPASHDSLASGVPPAAPGAIFALAISGGITVGPREGRELLFGRNRPDVHVCVGEDDPRISRQHGVLSCSGNQWWVRNVGRRPIRVADSPSRLLFTNDEPVPLGEGYTPLLVHGSHGREHLIQVHVTGPDRVRRSTRPDDETERPRIWRLDPEERLALIVLGQRYLRQDHPQPLSWRQAAEHLAELQPNREWTYKKLEHWWGRCASGYRTPASPG